MQNLFGHSVSSYQRALHYRWSKVLLQSYVHKRICVVGPFKSNQLFSNQADCFVNIVNDFCPSALCVYAEYDSLPLHNDFFDLVISFYAHENSKNFQDSLAELARIVSPQGVLVCWSAKNYSIQSVLEQHSMSFIRNVAMMYRPKLNNAIFNKLQFMELFSIMLPNFLAQINMSIWQKKQIGMILDESQLVLKGSYE